MCSLPIVSETIFATVQKKRTVKPKKAKRRKKKEKSRELYSTHFNTQQTHTHTRKEDRAIKKRDLKTLFP